MIGERKILNENNQLEQGEKAQNLQQKERKDGDHEQEN